MQEKSHPSLQGRSPKMRAKAWLLLGVGIAVCAAVPSSAGVTVGIVDGLTDTPDATGLNLRILHTTKRWDGGTLDTTRNVLSLEMKQTFAVGEAPEGKGLHVLLMLPSICRVTELSLEVGDQKLSPTACTPTQVTALVDWLLTNKAPKSLTRDSVRFLHVPLGAQLAAEDAISLALTCRIRPSQDGEALLFTVPQILHALEPEPIGELEYQIDVGPASSVETPGHVDDVKIEKNTPTDDWRRIHYGAKNVPTDGLEEFIIRIVR